MHAQNKPLTEYGDLNSVHHEDAHRAELDDVVEDSPPALIIKDGPGNMSFIGWTHGDNVVPMACHGYWNHKGKAQEAIDGVNARIAAESNEAAKAADDLRLQEEADQELIDVAIETAAELERITGEAHAVADEIKATEVKVTPKKRVTKPTK